MPAFLVDAKLDDEGYGPAERIDGSYYYSVGKDRIVVITDVEDVGRDPAVLSAKDLLVLNADFELPAEPLRALAERIWNSVSDRWQPPADLSDLREIEDAQRLARLRLADLQVLLRTAPMSGADSRGELFLSYVREDRDLVDRVEYEIRAAGWAVWRDLDRLSGGDDWKEVIRQAITRDKAAFIACISSSLQERDWSYMFRELKYAAEVQADLPPGRSWIIPVRLDDCEVPHIPLPGGKSLADLHRIDLFPSWENGMRKLRDDLTMLAK